MADLGGTLEALKQWLGLPAAPAQPAPGLPGGPIVTPLPVVTPLPPVAEEQLVSAMPKLTPPLPLPAPRQRQGLARPSVAPREPDALPMIARPAPAAAPTPKAAPQRPLSAEQGMRQEIEQSRRAEEQYRAAAQQAADLKSEAATVKAAGELDAATRYQQTLADLQGERDRIHAESQQVYDQLLRQNDEATKIDPRAAWHNMSFFEKALHLIGAGIGGWVTAGTGRPNPILQKLDKLNADAVDAQKFAAQEKRERLGVKINLWRNAYEMTRNEQAADALTAASIYDTMRQAVAAKAALRESPIAKVEAQKLDADFAMKASDKRREAWEAIGRQANERYQIAVQKKIAEGKMALDIGMFTMSEATKQAQAAAKGTGKDAGATVNKVAVTFDQKGKPTYSIETQVQARNPAEAIKLDDEAVSYATLRTAAERFVAKQKRIGSTYQGAGKNFGALASADQRIISTLHGALMQHLKILQTRRGVGTGAATTESEFERFLSALIGKGPEGLLDTDPTPRITTYLHGEREYIGQEMAQKTNWSQVGGGREWDDKPFMWEKKQDTILTDDQRLEKLRRRYWMLTPGIPAKAYTAGSDFRKAAEAIERYEGRLRAGEEAKTESRKAAEKKELEELLGE